ncbi:MAG: hypothetical protein V3U18_01390 [Alphaproteobacteria bacterium]|jgi:hypothetical protein
MSAAPQSDGHSRSHDFDGNRSLRALLLRLDGVSPAIRFEDNRALRAFLLRSDRDSLSERLLANLSVVTRDVLLAGRALSAGLHA